MRAPISTIPYGIEAPPPRPIPAEGLIHASTQSFATSFLALGSTGLIRFGPVTKEDFLHTHTLKNISRLAPGYLRSWTHRARSDWRWRCALGECFTSVEGYIYYHHLNHKRKSFRIFNETPLKHHTASVTSFPLQSSVNAQFVCGALEERSALKWTFSCVPKCFSCLAQCFFQLLQESVTSRSEQGVNVWNPGTSDSWSERIKRKRSWRGDGSSPVVGAHCWGCGCERRSAKVQNKLSWSADFRFSPSSHLIRPCLFDCSWWRHYYYYYYYKFEH